VPTTATTAWHTIHGRPLKSSMLTDKDEDWPIWEIDFEGWGIRKGFKRFLNPFATRTFWGAAWWWEAPAHLLLSNCRARARVSYLCCRGSHRCHLQKFLPPCLLRLMLTLLLLPPPPPPPLLLLRLLCLR
jgi:hypothetical protein